MPLKLAPTLQTERVLLVLFDDDNTMHYDGSLRMINAPETIAQMGDMGIRTREQYRKLLYGTLMQPPAMSEKLDQPAFWNVYLKDAAEHSEIIGGISISHRRSQIPPDIGWVIMPPHWGKGYATEAGKEVLRYALEELNLEKLIAYPLPTNIGSVRTAEKIGFVEGGTLRDEEGKQHAAYILPGMDRLEEVVINNYGDAQK